MSEKRKLEQAKNKDSKKMRLKLLDKLEKELLMYVAKKPKLYFTEKGVKATIKFPLNNEKNISFAPVFIEDIRNLLIKSATGNLPFPLRWLELESAHEISQTVLLEVNGLQSKNVSEMYSELFKKHRIFSNVFSVLSSLDSFASELSLPLFSTGFYSQAKDNYSALFPISKSTVITHQLDEQKMFTKLHLLLKPLELIMENFPLPQNVSAEENVHYLFTKTEYDIVTTDSPMFSIDCEMGVNILGGSEVLRVAIVNEQLESIYHSFVKPKVEIFDYVTRINGITEDMIKDVETTLGDVQKDIQNLLPADAILCGQSLEFDLHALKLIHPYIIDTSVIFNSYGIRQNKMSLKRLAKIYLKEIIQEGSHDPVEDARAAMKLVQYRLQFLNRIKSRKSPDKVTRRCGFFSKISKWDISKAVIGPPECLKSYCGDIYGSANVVEISNTKEVLQETVKKIENFDLIINHLNFDESKFSVNDLIREIKLIYESISKNSLFVVIMSDVGKRSNDNFKDNIGMIALKSYQF